MRRRSSLPSSIDQNQAVYFRAATRRFAAAITIAGIRLVVNRLANLTTAGRISDRDMATDVSIAETQCIPPDFVADGEAVR
jgi:hypothetical protein